MQSGASSVARINNSCPTSRGKYVLASACDLTSQEAIIFPGHNSTLWVRAEQSSLPQIRRLKVQKYPSKISRSVHSRLIMFCTPPSMT